MRWWRLLKCTILVTLTGIIYAAIVQLIVWKIQSFNSSKFNLSKRRLLSRQTCTFMNIGDIKHTGDRKQHDLHINLLRKGFKVEHIRVPANLNIVSSYVPNNRYMIWKKEIHYKPFNITEPNFVSKSDRFFFFNQSKNTDVLKNKFIPEELEGHVYIVPNGTFQMPFDCGWKSNVSYITKRRVVGKGKWHRILAPLIVPEGSTFQHFIDGTLPKIIQILELLQTHHVTLLIENPRDKVICDFLESLGISRNIIAFSGGNYGADYIIFSCNAPPVHPDLWKKARLSLGAPEVRQITWKDSYVVVVTRKGCFNCGRFILNMNEILNVLYKRYGKDKVRVYEGPYNLHESIELFGNAKIVIGVHGGGMYNTIYCPKGTIVIEFMPTTANGQMYAAAHKMIWAQSQMLDLIYWRFVVVTNDRLGNIHVNKTKFIMLLDKADPN